MTIKPHKLFELYTDGRRLYTQSLAPGTMPFDERIISEQNKEYREFDPTRSKLAAAIVKGSTNIGIRKGNIVLYLGVAHGYTASFISDMIASEGLLFGIDPAPRVMRDFVFLAEQRKNLVPLLADANHPEEYISRVCAVDIVYQDVAQRNQEDIFSRNCQLFLKKNGYGLLAVKARSIDIKRKPKDIFEEIRRKLEKNMTVIDYRILEPLEKDHCMIIVKK